MGNKNPKAKAAPLDIHDVLFELTFGIRSIERNIRDYNKQVKTLSDQIEKCLQDSMPEELEFWVSRKMELDQQIKKAKMMILRLEWIKGKIQNQETQKNIMETISNNVVPQLKESLSSGNLEMIARETNKFAHIFDRFSAQDQIIGNNMEDLSSTKVDWEALN